MEPTLNNEVQAADGTNPCAACQTLSDSKTMLYGTKPEIDYRLEARYVLGEMVVSQEATRRGRELAVNFESTFNPEMGERPPEIVLPEWTVHYLLDCGLEDEDDEDEEDDETLIEYRRDCPTLIYEDCLEWRDNQGRLHRGPDSPARIYSCGCKERWTHGLLTYWDPCSYSHGYIQKDDSIPEPDGTGPSPWKPARCPIALFFEGISEEMERGHLDDPVEDSTWLRIRTQTLTAIEDHPLIIPTILPTNRS